MTEPRRLCVRIVDPALDPTLPAWGDGQGGWQPAGLEWLGTLAAAGVPFRAGPDAGVDDGEGLLLLPDPDAVDLPVGSGRPLVTGPPPDGAEARLTVLQEALGALVVPDLRGALVLRLDDPGASVKRHLDSWRHDDVDPATWERLWQAVGAMGRMSVFCSPGWVDDRGRVTSSRDASPAEWAALDAGVRAGVADLECHGFTHLDPDLDAWAVADDRATDESWYRELWPRRCEREPDVERQRAILERWQAACGPGTTVVAPGERWGRNTLAAAKACGFQLFNSWGICHLTLPVPTWTTGIGSPYLDTPEPSLFADGLPQVGYWHDRDMAVHGPDWVDEQLSKWRDCGVRRTLSFADLARAYGPIDAALVDGDVVVRSAPDVPLRILRP